VSESIVSVFGVALQLEVLNFLTWDAAFVIDVAVALASVCQAGGCSPNAAATVCLLLHNCNHSL